MEVQYLAMGMYCLNRTQPGVIYVGTSNCTWIYYEDSHGMESQTRGDQWGWYNQSGMGQGFSHFWSSNNNTLFIETGGTLRPEAWRYK